MHSLGLLLAHDLITQRQPQAQPSKGPSAPALPQCAPTRRSSPQVCLALARGTLPRRLYGIHRNNHHMTGLLTTTLATKGGRAASTRVPLQVCAAVAAPEAPSATASSGGAGTRVMIIGVWGKSADDSRTHSR